MERTRDRDRAALPEPMRREVRLLGDILGEIIRDSGGPELLADVERLRHAVIEARQREPGPRRGGRRRDRHAGRVLEPGAGRAGGPGLRRLLPPGQPGRGAPAHPQPAGTRHRPGAGAGVAGRRRGRDQPRRRAGAPARAARVAAGAPGAHRSPHRGAAARGGGRAAPDQRAARRAGRPARRGGRPRRGAPRAARADRPAVADITAAGQGDGPHRRGPHGDDRVRRDAVPGGPRRVPGAGPGRGRDRRPGVAGAGLPALRQLGGRRPGRQPVRDRAGHPRDRDDPGRSRAARAGERHHPDRPGADPARGDDAALGRAAPGARRGARRAPGTAGRDRGALAAGAVPDLPALRGAADQRHPGPARRPGLPRPGRVPRRPAHGPGVAGRGRGRPAGPRRAAAPHLAGGDVRLPPGRPGGQAAQRGARPGAGRTPPRRPARLRAQRRPARRRARGAAVRADRGGAGHVPRGGLGAGPVRRGRVPPLRGQLHPLGRRHRRRARTGPLRHGRRPACPCSTWCRCSRARPTWPTRPTC